MGDVAVKISAPVKCPPNIPVSVLRSIFTRGSMEIKAYARCAECWNARLVARGRTGAREETLSRMCDLSLGYPNFIFYLGDAQETWLKNHFSPAEFLDHQEILAGIFRILTGREDCPASICHFLQPDFRICYLPIQFLNSYCPINLGR